MACCRGVKNISILLRKVWLFYIKFVYLSEICNLLKKIGGGEQLRAFSEIGVWVRVMLAMFLIGLRFVS